MKQDCDTCKHKDKNWDELPCDGCCTAHSGYEAGMNRGMTREEAINHLKTVAKSAIDSGYDSAVVDAVVMATKALEQEPCEDEYIKVPKNALKYRTKGMVAYNAEWLKNHFDIERAVICGVQEPKTGHWIPVSEKLPEDGQEILFSTKTGRVHSGKYHDDNSANQWYSHHDKCNAWNNVVTAWMPLPKPYEPQESEG